MDFALIETLRWDPADGFVRGGLHLERMGASAAALGFAFDEEAVLLAMEAVAVGDEPLRIRVELARNGQPTATAAPFLPHPQGTVWTLAIASTRLDSSDTLLRHKTTRRDIYASARAEYPVSQFEEVLLLNEDGLVCEGTITTVFARLEEDGPLLTPPLACGLLPGVLRRQMLESGIARESVLTTEDLAAAQELYCGNSLRGLIPAALA